MDTKQHVKMEREKDRLVNLHTQSGFEVKASYGPDDIADLDYHHDLGKPGGVSLYAWTFP